MVKSGDAQAVAIYEEYNGSVMTSFPSFQMKTLTILLPTQITLPLLL